MIMSLSKFDSLIDEFPQETGAIKRLECFILSQCKDYDNAPEVPVARIFDVVKPSNQRVLIKILRSVSALGYVRKIFRVNSLARGGIGDFESIFDIPIVMMDTRLGIEIEVIPSQIDLIYQFRDVSHIRSLN